MREKILLVLILTAGFLSGMLFSFVLKPQIGQVETIENKSIEIKGGKTINVARNQSLPDSVKTYLPAVSEDGGGIITPIWIKAERGPGKILVDIENLFFWVDIQYSIRMANSVAREYLNTSEMYDITYSIYTNSSIVGGPSAGGAMTIATIAAVKNKEINQSVVMTGAIDENGKIEPVGSVLEKARAAEERGFKKMLVPEGQTVETVYYQEEKCNNIGRFNICKTEYKEKKINITQRVNIKIVEVGKIEGCLGHFFVEG